VETTTLFLSISQGKFVLDVKNLVRRKIKKVLCFSTRNTAFLRPLFYPPVAYTVLMAVWPLVYSMGIMNEVKGGANLAAPRLSLGWIIGGLIAAFLLVGVVLVAIMGWGKVQTAIPATTSVMAPARVYMS
jgi:hypothetical protein